jgi:Leucine-rich repeat (LRR) protein
LEYLNLNNNPIEILPKDFTSLPNLKNLLLAKTRLSKLPFLIEKMNLEELDISNTPWELMAEILPQTSEDVQNEPKREEKNEGIIKKPKTGCFNVVILFILALGSMATYFVLS